MDRKAMKFGMDLKPIQLGIVTREVKSTWGNMEVGPICDQDVALRPEERVCTVHQGIFYGGTSPAASGDEDVTSDSVSPLSGAVKGSNFSFGTRSVVTERDETSTQFWVRQKNTSDIWARQRNPSDTLGWLTYDRYLGWLPYDRQQDSVLD